MNSIRRPTWPHVVFLLITMLLTMVDQADARRGVEMNHSAPD